ncbi:MAG: hypothetical protein ABSA58_16500 [Acetobacteraceae bacterium]
MSTSVMDAGGHAAAPTLPDVLPEPKQRGRVMGFVHRHPTIVLGGSVVALMVLIAIFAPFLATVDPTALAPAKRTRCCMARAFR